MAGLLDVQNANVIIDSPRGELHLLRDVSLGVAPGETVGLVGESGSGKSLLIRLILGLLPPRARLDSGTVGLDGRELTDSSSRRLGVDIALVPQDPLTSLNPVRRIDKQLASGLRYHQGLSRQDADARSRELLDAVGIPDPDRVMKSYPHELSGGMRQRVLISATIACQPRLLLADEPTTALDVTVQKQILDLLDTLRRQQGMGMLLVSHDLSVVAGRSDRIAVMYAGRLVEILPAARLRKDAAHPYTRGLMRSHPDIHAPRGAHIDAIEGSPPDPTLVQTGCAFAVRCPRRTPQCDTVVPALQATSPGHLVACHNPEATLAGSPLPVQMGSPRHA